MGRGLSELQKYILTAAALQKDDESSGGCAGRLYNADILKEFYGWKGDNGLPGDHKFNPKEIGQKKYDSAHVAVRKACARLEKRGLVVCILGAHSHWSGVEITDKGREVAANIMAKTNIADKKPRKLTPEEIAVLDKADNKQPAVTAISLEEIEDARKKYAQNYMVEHNYSVCWTCGDDWSDRFVCNFCHTHFYADIPDMRYCPCCGRTDIVAYLDHGDSPTQRMLSDLYIEAHPDRRNTSEDRNKPESPAWLKEKIAEKERGIQKAENHIKKFKLRLKRAEAGIGYND